MKHKESSKYIQQSHIFKFLMSRCICLQFTYNLRFIIARVSCSVHLRVYDGNEFIEFFLVQGKIRDLFARLVGQGHQDDARIVDGSDPPHEPVFFEALALCRDKRRIHVKFFRNDPDRYPVTPVKITYCHENQPLRPTYSQHPRQHVTDFLEVGIDRNDVPNEFPDQILGLTCRIGATLAAVLGGPAR